MHSHFSAIHAAGIFLAVLVWGTLWRLAAAHMVASNNPTLQYVGQAMAFQY
jgi:hypothetical protein